MIFLLEIGDFCWIDFFGDQGFGLKDWLLELGLNWFDGCVAGLNWFDLQELDWKLKLVPITEPALIP